ncbi:MAG: hypothetical protein ACXW0L_09305 [Methylosarcina sp.]
MEHVTSGIIARVRSNSASYEFSSARQTVITLARRNRILAAGLADI